MHYYLIDERESIAAPHRLQCSMCQLYLSQMGGRVLPLTVMLEDDSKHMHCLSSEDDGGARIMIRIFA